MDYYSKDADRENLDARNDSRGRKSSILKPPKARIPLVEVDFGNNDDLEDLTEVSRKRRVSFAGVNKIKEFNSKAESFQVLHTPAYEEMFSLSSDSPLTTSNVAIENIPVHLLQLKQSKVGVIATFKNGTAPESIYSDNMDLTNFVHNYEIQIEKNHQTAENGINATALRVFDMDITECRKTCFPDFNSGPLCQPENIVVPSKNVTTHHDSMYSRTMEVSGITPLGNTNIMDKSHPLTALNNYNNLRVSQRVEKCDSVPMDFTQVVTRNEGHGSSVHMELTQNCGNQDYTIKDVAVTNVKTLLKSNSIQTNTTAEKTKNEDNLFCNNIELNESMELTDTWRGSMVRNTFANGCIPRPNHYLPTEMPPHSHRGFDSHGQPGNLEEDKTKNIFFKHEMKGCNQPNQISKPSREGALAFQTQNNAQTHNGGDILNNLAIQKVDSNKKTDLKYHMGESVLYVNNVCEKVESDCMDLTHCAIDKNEISRSLNNSDKNTQKPFTESNINYFASNVMDLNCPSEKPNMSNSFGFADMEFTLATKVASKSRPTDAIEVNGITSMDVTLFEPENDTSNVPVIECNKIDHLVNCDAKTTNDSCCMELTAVNIGQTKCNVDPLLFSSFTNCGKQLPGFSETTNRNDSKPNCYNSNLANIFEPQSAVKTGSSHKLVTDRDLNIIQCESTLIDMNITMVESASCYNPISHSNLLKPIECSSNMEFTTVNGNHSLKGQNNCNLAEPQYSLSMESPEFLDKFTQIKSNVGFVPNQNLKSDCNLQKTIECSDNMDLTSLVGNYIMNSQNNETNKMLIGSQCETKCTKSLNKSTGLINTHVLSATTCDRMTEGRHTKTLDCPSNMDLTIAANNYDMIDDLNNSNKMLTKCLPNPILQVTGATNSNIISATNCHQISEESLEKRVECSDNMDLTSLVGNFTLKNQYNKTNKTLMEFQHGKKGLPEPSKILSDGKMDLTNAIEIYNMNDYHNNPNGMVVDSMIKGLPEPVDNQTNISNKISDSTYSVNLQKTNQCSRKMDLTCLVNNVKDRHNGTNNIVIETQCETKELPKSMNESTDVGNSNAGSAISCNKTYSVNPAKTIEYSSNMDLTIAANNYNMIDHSNNSNKMITESLCTMKGLPNPMQQGTGVINANIISATKCHQMSEKSVEKLVECSNNMDLTSLVGNYTLKNQHKTNKTLMESQCEIKELPKSLKKSTDLTNSNIESGTIRNETYYVNLANTNEYSDRIGLTESSGNYNIDDHYSNTNRIVEDSKSTTKGLPVPLGKKTDISNKISNITYSVNLHKTNECSPKMDLTCLVKNDQHVVTNNTLIDTRCETKEVRQSVNKLTDVRNSSNRSTTSCNKVYDVSPVKTSECSGVMDLTNIGCLESPSMIKDLPKPLEKLTTETNSNIVPDTICKPIDCISLEKPNDPTYNMDITTLDDTYTVKDQYNWTDKTAEHQCVAKEIPKSLKKSTVIKKSIIVTNTSDIIHPNISSATNCNETCNDPPQKSEFSTLHGTDEPIIELCLEIKGSPEKSAAPNLPKEPNSSTKFVVDCNQTSAFMSETPELTRCLNLTNFSSNYNEAEEPPVETKQNIEDFNLGNNLLVPITIKVKTVDNTSMETSNNMDAMCNSSKDSLITNQCVSTDFSSSLINIHLIKNNEKLVPPLTTDNSLVNKAVTKETSDLSLCHSEQMTDSHNSFSELGKASHLELISNMNPENESKEMPRNNESFIFEANNAFMKKYKFKHYSGTIWKRSFLYGAFFLVLDLTTDLFENDTPIKDISFEENNEITDGLLIVFAKIIIDKYNRALKIKYKKLNVVEHLTNNVMQGIALTKPFRESVNYVRERYPCTIEENSLQFRIINVRHMLMFDILIDLKLWSNMTGKSLKIRQSYGRINEVLVRSAFSRIPIGKERFYQFANYLAETCSKMKVGK